MFGRLDSFEQVFEHRWVSVTPLDPVRSELLVELQQKVERIQSGPAAEPVATHPALSGLLQLRAGGVYGVDSASAALLLAAGPSLAGGWCGIVGVPDLGVEAAQTYGLQLERTVVVPDPRERWLEVVAALVDVVDLVLVRPPGPVRQGEAARLAARLRKRGVALVAWGEWPRCDARLTVAGTRWEGLGQGHGRLAARRVRLEVRRGAAPARGRELWLPAADLGVRQVEPVVALAPAPAVREVS